jgi:xanthine dehydrogenase small subunit
MDKDLINSGIHEYIRIVFFLNGKAEHRDLAPGLSTLDLINKELRLWGTKCSCNEGDCGACTVVIGSLRDGNIVYEAVNSCLYPAARLHGKHLITIEGLGDDNELHPIQRAILDHHASQCGYCTPGFVMSMFALFASQKNPSKETIMAALEGNLCRCTGYQSILDAALEISATHDPQSIVPRWCRDTESEIFTFDRALQTIKRSSDSHYLIENYYKATDVQMLKALLAAHPEAAIIAGGTDVMVQVNITRRHFAALIDIADIQELQKIYLRPDGVHIGAGVTYSRIMESGIIRSDYPALTDLFRLVASTQIRNFGTLAGNIANASPIGDSLPLLMVYGATLELDSASGKRAVPIREFFTGYRKTALKPVEFISEIVIPSQSRTAHIRALKTSKRKAVDISSVASAVKIERDPQGRVTAALLAFGGVAATPVFSETFAKMLTAAEPRDAKLIADTVAGEFEPLSDVRGSAEYRKTMIRNHVLQYLEELR